MTNYLEVKNLSKSFDSFQLHNISTACCTENRRWRMAESIATTLLPETENNDALLLYAADLQGGKGGLFENRGHFEKMRPETVV